MANIKQARKRANQAEKRRARNAATRSQMRTASKRVIKAILAGDKEQADSALRAAVARIDKTAQKGIIHKNTAARQKGRLSARVNSLAG